jgi:hypothetical protein
VLQRRYSGVTVVLQWCHSCVTAVLQWCYSSVTVVLYKYRMIGLTIRPLASRASTCEKVSRMATINTVAPTHSGVTVVLQRCYNGVTVVLQWCYSGVTVVLQWCYSGVKCEKVSRMATINTAAPANSKGICNGVQVVLQWCQ